MGAIREIKKTLSKPILRQADKEYIISMVEDILREEWQYETALNAYRNNCQNDVVKHLEDIEKEREKEPFEIYKVRK